MVLASAIPWMNGHFGATKTNAGVSAKSFEPLGRELKLPYFCPKKTIVWTLIKGFHSIVCNTGYGALVFTSLLPKDSPDSELRGILRESTTSLVTPWDLHRAHAESRQSCAAAAPCPQG
jgi:hypothetical protein